MDSSYDQEVGLGFGKAPALDPGPAGYSGGGTAEKLRAAAIPGGPGGTQSTPGGEGQQCEEWNPWGRPIPWWGLSRESLGEGGHHGFCWEVLRAGGWC